MQHPLQIEPAGQTKTSGTPAPASSVPKPVAGAPTDSDATDPVLEGDDLIDGGDSKDDEKDDALIEDTSDLGRDDNGVSEVKEHIDDGVEDKN